MKKPLLLTFLIASIKLYGQFPAPNNFNYELDYIGLEQWSVCNGQTIYGPAYCSHFNWNFPDTSMTDSQLDGFEIYNVFNNNTYLVQSLTDTLYITTTPYQGDLYVIALYSDPSGKSDPSNVVNNPGIPINNDENKTIENISVNFNSVSKQLNVKTNKVVKNISVLNIYGQIVFNNLFENKVIDLNYLCSGIYIVEIIFENNKTFSEKIMIE